MGVCEDWQWVNVAASAILHAQDIGTQFVMHGGRWLFIMYPAELCIWLFSDNCVRVTIRVSGMI